MSRPILAVHSACVPTLRAAIASTSSAVSELQTGPGSKLVGRGPSGVAQLLVPVDWPSLGGEVEQVPERFERADVTGFLSGVGGRVEELRTPEVANRVTVAVEHVQHRSLRSLGGLGVVVAVVGGTG